MLKLCGITKDYYLKDQEPVHALKGIDLNFRRNEFVAILGHSGCGKTTLLNIIGGLDKYTNGDLVIEGKSTKDYKDGDWDTYRNHSIGFIFQSYNLIGHQSLLSNVELALTISGVDKKERKARAKEALAKVGLVGMEKKKPSQLSGGQMQRVAIARALVNNPEILLADEPTGALDSETSIQIMDLLKEVAKDRLVIMVTHNPDLAYQYANRIVKMSDGLIIDDSNPYNGETKEERDKAIEEKSVSKGKKKKSSMSFATASSLSMANLISKLRRTILIVIAGSIGIIGVTAVLAVSNGVSNYVGRLQKDMLSSYPIEITEETVDYTSLMTGLDNADKKELSKFDLNTQVGINSMINYLMTVYKGLTATKTNDISKELVDYIDNISSEDAAIKGYDYGIDVTNNIFGSWKNNTTDTNYYTSLNGLTQSYIAELKTVEGFSDYASYVDLFTNFMKELPNNKDYILNEYELLGDSKFAENENEIMLVIDPSSTITDLTLAQLGYFEHDEFLNIAKFAIKTNEEGSILKSEEATKEQKDEFYNQMVEKYPYKRFFDYSELLNKEFYYFPHDELYKYGELESSETDNVSLVLTQGTSIISLNYDQKSDTLSGVCLDTSNSSYGICFLQRQGEKVDFEALENKNDCLKGAWAGILGDMNHYFIINIANPNSSTSEMEVMKYVNASWTTDDISKIEEVIKTTPTLYSATSTVNKTHNYVSGYNYAASLSDEMIENYQDYNGTKMKVVGILRAKKTTNFGCLSSGVYYTKDFADKYIEDSINSEIINNAEHGIKSYIGSDAEKAGAFNAYVTYDYLDWTDEDNPVKKSGYSSCLNGDLSSSFSNLFSSLTGVNYTEQDCTYLRSLSGLKALKQEDGTYLFEKLPKSIKIYPYDFECKDHITDYLDAWNDNEDHSQITYSDTIEIIVAVIDTLIEAITIALVAFSSLALVVSCFMITVITYISVMERVKEIGVIRSLGGRKKDVSRLFIAETLVIGTLSGLFGIIMTYVICIILNLIVAKYNIGNLGDLTASTALIMIGLSIILNVVSGLVPSMRASKQDPVLALRSE